MLRMAICVVLALGGLAFSTDKCLSQRYRYNPGRRTQDMLYNRPTVSPYLNLLQRQGSGLPIYQTLVRPQIEQRRQNQQTQQQISQLQSYVAQSSMQGQRGDTTFRPTGHTTGFFYYSHFYPTLAQQRRR